MILELAKKYSWIRVIKLLSFALKYSNATEKKKCIFLQMHASIGRELRQSIYLDSTVFDLLIGGWSKPATGRLLTSSKKLRREGESSFLSELEWRARYPNLNNDPGRPAEFEG